MHCLYNSQFFSTQKIRGRRISKEESASWPRSWDQSRDANRAPDNDLHTNLAKSAQLRVSNLIKLEPKLEPKLGSSWATVNHPIGNYRKLFDHMILPLF